MKASLEIVVRNENSSFFSIEGEIDIITSKSLNLFLDSMIDNIQSDMTIDCEKLEYIDSCGINILEKALDKMQKYNASISLLNAKRSIRKLFEISGLDDRFVFKTNCAM